MFKYLMCSKKNILNSYCKNPTITSQQMSYNTAVLSERPNVKTEKV